MASIVETIKSVVGLSSKEENMTEDEKLEEKIYRVAKEKYGISKDDLKDHQIDSCKSIVNGQDVSIVQPPGAGKSMCFAMPTFLTKMRALVIEPIPPLMFDEKHGLEKKGLKVAVIDNTYVDAKGENKDVDVADMLKKADIIYVTPDACFDDKGKNTKVMDALIALNQTEKFVLVALDEAHLAWHEPKPHFKALRNLKNLFPNVPLMTATGTATKSIRQKLLKELLRADRSKELWASVDAPSIQARCYYVEVKKGGGKKTKNDKADAPHETKTTPAGVIMNSEFTLRFPQQEYHLNCWSISGMESTVTVRTSDGSSYAFDMGQATRPSISADHVFITHGHTDHCGAIHKHVAQRDLLRRTPATYFCPTDIEESLKAICRQYAIMGEYNKPTMENPKITPISLGTRIALSNKRTLVPFVTYHRVPSQGYMIYSKEHVLKSEYAHLDRRQANELASQGIPVREWKEVPEIATLATPPSKPSRIPSTQMC